MEITLLCIKAVIEYVKMIMNTEATLKMEKPRVETSTLQCCAKVLSHLTFSSILHIFLGKLEMGSVCH